MVVYQKIDYQNSFMQPRCLEKKAGIRVTTNDTDHLGKVTAV